MIIKKYNDFITESVEIKNNNEFNNILKKLEEYGYNIIDISIGDTIDGGSIYFVIEGKYPFTLSYCDNGTNIMVIVELEDGTTDSLGCFSSHDNIVKTITDVIISYCEQPIENITESIVKDYTYKEINKFLDNLNGKKVSFYEKGKNYIQVEVINEIELTPDEMFSDKSYNTYDGGVWLNDKEVDTNKEIKIIK